MSGEDWRGLCPHCGQPMPKPAIINSADDLISAMRNPLGRDGKPRDVYETGRNPNKICMTYGHETVSRLAVVEALRRGLISLTYGIEGYWSLTQQPPPVSPSIAGREG